jgi:nucleotide-binding universal stress UspA family protein
MIKTVLVNLNGDERDTSVLDTAAVIFGRFHAHFDCIHVKVDPVAQMVYAGDIAFGTSIAVAETLEISRQDAERRARRARESFVEFCRRQDVARVEAPPAPHRPTAAWSECSGDSTEVLAAAARHHDALVIAGASHRADTLTIDDLGSIVIGSGRPVLLVPEGEVHHDCRTIAIAWKDTAECARAVTAAMPLLEQAEKVVVLAASEAPQRAGGFAQSLNAVVQQLQWHGISAEGCSVDPAESTIPDAVLAAARRSGADLLVMGAYGHSRLRELIFGGFTDRVLKGTDVPVLMTH